jgi:hypothetical protein
MDEQEMEVYVISFQSDPEYLRACGRKRELECRTDHIRSRLQKR